jgi:hypothetical protein
MIIKTEWHRSDKTPESEIYISIANPFQGLVKFECADVKFAGNPIAVQNLQSSSP